MSVATQTPTKMAARTTAKPTTVSPSHKSSIAPTRPTAYKQVDGQTLKYVIRDLPYFQEYIIKVSTVTSTLDELSLVPKPSSFILIRKS